MGELRGLWMLIFKVTKHLELLSFLIYWLCYHIAACFAFIGSANAVKMHNLQHLLQHAWHRNCRVVPLTISMKRPKLWTSHLFRQFPVPCSVWGGLWACLLFLDPFWLVLSCGSKKVNTRKQPVFVYARLVKGFIDPHNEDGSGSFSLPVTLSK